MSRYDPIEDKKSNSVLIGLIIIVLAGGAAWLYFNRPSQQTEKPEIQELKLPLVSEDKSSAETLPDNMTTDQALPDAVDLDMQALPVQTSVLPVLSKSDSAFREAIVSASPKLKPWLKTDQVIRKYLIVVNDFSQGLWLEKHMRFLKHSKAFSVETNDKGLFIADESYRRYDALASAIDAIDTKKAIEAYKQFKPLLLEAFSDFGYPPERPLEDIFLKSASQILAAPIIKEPIALVRPSVFYKYANEDLESLSPVSKQMLRMGPKNTRIIQNKVRQLVQELINLKDKAQE